MPSAKINISKIAELANLSLSADEKNKLEGQLESTLDYIEELQEVNTEKIKPTSQVTGLENITRIDEISNCELTQDQALSNAKSQHNGLFKVEAILDND